MKVGDKVIVDPILLRSYDFIWGIPMEQIKGKIMTIKRIGDDDSTSYCYVEEEIFIPAEGTLFLAIHKRRQYGKRG